MMMSKSQPTICLFLLLMLVSIPLAAVFAQSTTPTMDGAKVQHAIKKLKTLGSVLYVAAHPDDENTRMIAYLTNGRHLRTGYLSLTRGDGGQNLVGKEVREELGVIRTQELMAARRIDGGEQFFTRANDFGYSKSADETFEIWDRKLVLADVVLAIRRFKPDVIITRFSPNPMQTHGHHTASAILALEAFKAAGDPAMFPEQLTEVAVWKPKRIFWNTSSFFYRGMDFSGKGLLQMDVGQYNTLLGKSYGEIAAASRSQHRSQGFGSAMQRGESIEYLQQLDGSRAESDIMEGIDTDWSRLPKGEKVEDLIDEIYHSFDIEKPERSIEDLLDLHSLIQNYLPSEWAEIKIRELEMIILQCAGVWAEATIDRFSAAPGDEVKLTARVIKRMDVPMTLQAISFPGVRMDSSWKMPNNQMMEQSVSYTIPETSSISQPYWLRDEATLGMYSIDDLKLIGMPENKPELHTSFTFWLGSGDQERMTIRLPIQYRWVDPADGEMYRPFQIAPPVTVSVDQPVYVAFGQRNMEMKVTIQSHTDQTSGYVKLLLPDGWQMDSDSLVFDFDKAYQEQRIKVQVTPPATSGQASLKALVNYGGGMTDAHALTEIDYPHISAQSLFPETTANLVKLDISTMGKKIAYIPGAGDMIPDALRAVGYEVTILDGQPMNATALAQFDAIVLGIRALNTNDQISNWIPSLLTYAKEGGHVVMQYNTKPSWFALMKTDEFSPYPIQISRNRVTREDAKIEILAPDHLILDKPNKITQADFDGWVQERGLYFPDQWDSAYTAILSSRDPNEQDLKGGLLVCDYGEGSFVYTSYSWFRQLPAGVPGAYRLFINLVSYGEAKRSANRD